MSMNEDLIRELKVAHYKLSRFSESAGTRSGMGDALVVTTKFSIGIQMEDLEVPIRAMIEALAKDGSEE